MTRFIRIAVLLSAAAALPFALACSKSGNPAATDKQYGTLEIRVRVVNSPLAKNAGQTGTLATVADSLVVVVKGEGITDSLRRALRLGSDLSRPSVSAAFQNIPSGTNRAVTIFAVDRNGVTTHIDSVVSHTVAIGAERTTVVPTTLIPARGSIYLQFLNLPTSTSVYARFAADDGSFTVESTVNREARTFVNLDNIPHNTAGILTVIILNAAGDTLRIAREPLTFNARGDISIDLNFETVGGDGGEEGGAGDGSIEFDLFIYEPGVTIGSYYFDRDDPHSGGTAVTETGELIITELMWNITAERYIELYNARNETVTFDTLVIDVNTGSNSFFNVTFEPHTYRVFGRNTQYSDHAFDPVFTSPGNWITVRRRDGAVIDRVIFATGTSNNTGWPTMAGTARRSIELNRDKYHAVENNYGKNWSVVETSSYNLIEGVEAATYGTPGR